MEIRKIQFILSILFLTSYLAFVSAILYVEVSDTINMVKGENSMMGELKVLLGVLTAAVAQVLHFWFNSLKISNTPNDNVPSPNDA